MWIRSQCKQDIVSTNAVWCADSFILKDGNYIVCMSGGIKFLLGEYSTKEKALKVLDEIEEFINEPIYTNELANEYAHYVRSVYQMPQDDEVIVDG